MKRIGYLAVLILLIVSLSACKTKETDKANDVEEENVVTLYYLNPDETGLVEYPYEVTSIPKDVKKAIKMILNQLKESPDLGTYKAVLTDSMGLQKINVQDGYVSLDFNMGYSKMEAITEVLCRAALVKSITGLSGVNNVEFTINGQPTTNQDRQIIGSMNANSFIDQDVSLSDYEIYGEISLYFANEAGDRLVEYPTQLETGENISVEQKIIEQLIEGPRDSKLKSTIPEGTKVIKTSSKDGICYVDLNSKFLDGVADIKDEVIIYSIVNSLVELPNVNKVQFTIEGQRVAKYRENIAFDGIFERNLDLISGSKE